MPAYSNHDAPDHCMIKVVHEPTPPLHRFQLSLRCPVDGKPLYYEIELEKKGGSGTSRTRQAGHTIIDAEDLVVGDMKVNLTASDIVLVNATLRDSEQNIVAETSQSFAAQ